MDKELCAGGIVIGDGGTIALVRHAKSQLWLFPKGHIDPNESDEDAARREVEEETGLSSLELIADLGSYERLSIPYPGHPTPLKMKNIHMFLFAAPQGSGLSPSLEIGEAKWVSVKNVGSEVGSDKDRAWFATVFPRVLGAIQRD